MGRRTKTVSRDSEARPRVDFSRGLRHFHNKDYAAAVALFRMADEQADLTDAFHARYTAYHGLSRVFLGDSRGIKLCHKAAAGEASDAQVYHNLALAELHLENREAALAAVRRGLRIAPGHAALRQLQAENNLSAPGNWVRRLRRHRPLDRMLGWVLRSRRQPGG